MKNYIFPIEPAFKEILNIIPEFTIEEEKQVITRYENSHYKHSTFLCVILEDIIIRKNPSYYIKIQHKVHKLLLHSSVITGLMLLKTTFIKQAIINLNYRFTEEDFNSYGYRLYYDNKLIAQYKNEYRLVSATSNMFCSATIFKIEERDNVIKTAYKLIKEHEELYISNRTET